MSVLQSAQHQLAALLQHDSVQQLVHAVTTYTTPLHAAVTHYVSLTITYLISHAQRIEPLLNSLIAVSVISVIPFLIVGVLGGVSTLTGGSKRGGSLLSDKTLKVLVAFAVGGLLGDSFLHLLPHALDPHAGHSHAVSATSSTDTYLPRHELFTVDDVVRHARHQTTQVQHHVVNVYQTIEQQIRQTTPHIATYTKQSIVVLQDALQSLKHRVNGLFEGSSIEHSDTADLTINLVPEIVADATTVKATTHLHEHAHEEDEHDHDHLGQTAHEHTHTHEVDGAEHDHSEHSHSHDHDAHPPTSRKLLQVTTAKITPATHSHSHDHAHSHGAAHDHSSHSHSHDHAAAKVQKASAKVAAPAKPAKPAKAASTAAHSHSHEHDHSSHSHSSQKNMPSAAPYTYDHHDDEHDHLAGMNVGLQILGGMLAFFVLEKLARLRHGGEGGHGHSHGPKAAEPSVSKKQTTLAGFLNIIGDVTHNFTDGMAITASFLHSPALGVTTSIAVLIHEIPHEIGDLAILLQSGWSITSAVWVQLLTALGAVAGVVFTHSISTQNTADVTSHTQSISSLLLPFTAGGFIYVGLVDVLPTLLTDDSGLTLKQTVKEVIAMVSGVGLMYVIGLYE